MNADNQDFKYFDGLVEFYGDIAGYTAHNR
jgi:hypothetical protein